MDSLNLKPGSQVRIKVTNLVYNQTGLNDLFNLAKNIIAQIASKYIWKGIE
jgi:hypothetical protein